MPEGENTSGTAGHVIDAALAVGLVGELQAEAISPIATVNASVATDALERDDVAAAPGEKENTGRSMFADTLTIAAARRSRRAPPRGAGRR